MNDAAGGAQGRFDAPMTVPQILFGFKGRIPRKTYWIWGVVVLVAFSVFASLLLGILGIDEWAASVLVNLAILWPAFAVSVKRWHDRDKSGWWLLINFIPLVGWIWALVENGFLRGTAGANRFGDDLTERF
ncbi:DUF805 domain-containing protein [Caldimonas sp. KR1-144]|uniref:DUF805 domain-containing protein n=1 Tax=Caldimonas sp. KR1-144 TaxID=3400911 RepID=UPI003C0B2C1E